MYVTQFHRALETILASGHAVLRQHHGAEFPAPIVECWDGGDKVSVRMVSAVKMYGRRPMIMIDLPFGMFEGAELDSDVFEEAAIELFAMFAATLNQFKYAYYGRPTDLHNNLSAEAKTLKNTSMARIFDAEATESAKEEMQADPNSTMELEGDERID